MKGALYILGAKAPQNFAILDSRLWSPYLLAILGCQHQERPSVQNLIRSVTHDYIIRVGEPSTLKNSIESESLQQAADHVEEMISIVEDQDLVERVAQKVQARTVQKNEAYDQLVRGSAGSPGRLVLMDAFLADTRTLAHRHRPEHALAVQAHLHSPLARLHPTRPASANDHRDLHGAAARVGASEPAHALGSSL